MRHWGGWSYQRREAYDEATPNPKEIRKKKKHDMDNNTLMWGIEKADLVKRREKEPTSGVATSNPWERARNDIIQIE